MAKPFCKNPLENMFWIVGVPSGESFEVTKEQLDSLFTNKLVTYTTGLYEEGFTQYLDKDLYKIKSFIGEPTKDKKPTRKLYLEYPNVFGQKLLIDVKNIVDEQTDFLTEIYVNKDLLSLSYKNYLLEIRYIGSSMSKKGHSSIYYIKKYKRGTEVDRYTLNEDLLLNRIEEELFNI